MKGIHRWLVDSLHKGPVTRKIFPFDDVVIIKSNGFAWSIYPHSSGLHHCMMTSSNGNIFRVTGHLCGEFTGPSEFPAQKPVTRSVGVSLICVWIHDWINNRGAGNLRRYRAHYDVIVMDTREITWLPRCHWSNLQGYGKIYLYQKRNNTTKHEPCAWYLSVLTHMGYRRAFQKHLWALKSKSS